MRVVTLLLWSALSVAAEPITDRTLALVGIASPLGFAASPVSESKRAYSAAKAALAWDRTLAAEPSTTFPATATPAYSVIDFTRFDDKELRIVELEQPVSLLNLGFWETQVTFTMPLMVEPGGAYIPARSGITSMVEVLTLESVTHVPAAATVTLGALGLLLFMFPRYFFQLLRRRRTGGRPQVHLPRR